MLKLQFANLLLKIKKKAFLRITNYEQLDGYQQITIKGGITKPKSS